MVQGAYKGLVYFYGRTYSASVQMMPAQLLLEQTRTENGTKYRTSPACDKTKSFSILVRGEIRKISLKSFWNVNCKTIKSITTFSQSLFVAEWNLLVPGWRVFWLGLCQLSCRTTRKACNKQNFSVW